MPEPARCTEVSPLCPVSATTYGYRPNLAGNIILLVVFGICTIVQLVLGIRHRLRAFTFAVTLGCLGEAIGYGGRLMMNDNPWSSSGFKVQIVCLILSPSFLAAGIYLTLKHLVIYFGQEMSRLKPGLYTWIFISCDIVSILVQAAGGGIASGETTNLVNVGNDIMITGIAIQVATMFICLCLAADFAINLLRRHGVRNVGAAPTDKAEALPGSFRYFAACCAVAFITIFIRCVYRIPEMSGGWGNPLMQNEVEFMVLDGTMIAIASILLTVAHPGIFFPAISSRHPHAPQNNADASPSIEKASA